MTTNPRRIDTHVHVGWLGRETHPEWGRISPWMQRQLAFKIFLAYAGIKPDQVSDQTFREATVRTLAGCALDHVVCLALDPVYDRDGRRREDLSNMWVDNDYVLDLQQDQALGSKVLLGASVHPYDPAFPARVEKYAEKATLVKWLPSAQQIDLADDRVLEALRVLARAKGGGRPLPLLLHLGPEHAIVTSDPRTESYDFLGWDRWDRMRNRFRPKRKRWSVPDIAKIHRNLRAGLESGACIIFAHCGLPYFAPRWLGRLAEHSDFDVVRDYLERYSDGASLAGRCFADVSACVTPVRKGYYRDIARLPARALLAGSDFPVPVFELSADFRGHMADFKAILRGAFERVVIPEDNLLNVNWRELEHAFPGHPMFRNAEILL